MAERTGATESTGSLTASSLQLATGPVGGVSLAVAPPATRLILRGTEAASPAGTALGLALPRQPCRAAIQGAVSALWLGPDEWLLLSEDGASDTGFTSKIEAALAPVPHSLVDVSHRQIALLLAGETAEAALGMFVPLDLSLPAFPVDMVVRTIFEKAEIVAWRRDPVTFRIEVWRSFAPYVASLLSLAQKETTL